MSEEDFESEEDKKNDEWLKKNFNDLIQTYPREWIAVMGGKVIANASIRSEVERLADGIAGGQEYSVYFIPPTRTSTDVGYSSRR